jgi:hypothetical protein
MKTCSACGEVKPVAGFNGNRNSCWAIDHIIPLASVDLTKRENVKKVCHFTNLRPLWQIDNIRRRFVEEDQYGTP